MTCLSNSFCVERILNSSTIFVTLQNAEYRSPRETELQTVQSDLADVDGSLESVRNVVDFSV